MIFYSRFSSVESSSENCRYYFTLDCISQFLWFFWLFISLLSFSFSFYFHLPANTTRLPGSTHRLSFPFFSHTRKHTPKSKRIELNVDVGANQTDVVFCVASPFDSVSDVKITVKTQIYNRATGISCVRTTKTINWIGWTFKKVITLLKCSASEKNKTIEYTNLNKKRKKEK